MRSRRTVALQRPFVLLHFPPIFVAAAVASAILVGAAAAAPLFRSVTGTAAVTIGIGAQGDRALVIARSGPLAADIIDLRDDEVRAATARIEDLAPPTETLVGSRVRFAGAGRPATARIATRTDYAAHVQILDGSADAGGLWLPERLATAIDVSVGDRVTVFLGGRTETVPVGAIFSASRSDPYWAPLYADESRAGRGGFALIDRAGFLKVETSLEDSGRQTWTFALAPSAVQRLTLERAATLSAGILELARDAAKPTLEFGTALGGPSVTSPVFDAVGDAEAGQRTITPPTQTLALAGELVAFFGILAAGVYGVRRRRVELRSLDAKGITWRALWGRSAAESILPIVVGGAVGWLATWAGIRALGPADIVETSAVRSSAVASVICVAGAVVVIATVTAVSSRRQALEGVRGAPPTTRASWWWELPVLAVAAASLYEIWTRGTSAISVQGSEVQVDRLLLLFPILFMAGCAGIVVRGLARALLRLRGSESWPTSLFLASRRVSTAPRGALLLVTATALAIGVLAYAGIAVTTIRASIREKVLVSTGADVTASTPGPIFPPPEGSSLRTTNVFHLPFVRAGAEGQTQITLVGVEPDSFAAAASWEAGFSSTPLPELMRRLSAPAGEPLPAIVVEGALSGQDPALDLAGYRVTFDIVGTASAFPGSEGGAVVVSAPALRAVLDEHDATIALRGADYRAWAHGDAGQARAFLLASGADPTSVVVAADRLQTPAYRALAWSFVFMELIGLVTAVVALIGLLLYLQARLRSRELAYALARRMGLSSATHRLSVAVEIAGLLAAAYAIGSILALSAAMLVYRRLDPLPDLTPAPVLRAPGALFLWIAVAIATCAVAGAWFVHRKAERADVGAVLRFAE